MKPLATCLALAMAAIWFLACPGPSCWAAQSDYNAILRRDKARDAQTPAKPLAKDKPYWRYVQKKGDLRRDIKPGEHLTPAKPGRPPGSNEAQKRLGLKQPPKYRGDITVNKGQPMKQNKVIGGKPGYGEAISTQKIPRQNVKKITKIR